jgi:hypothetical protein
MSRSKFEEFQISRKKKSRLYMIEALGGKCVICGYNKTYKAFDIHHLHSKLFVLNNIILNKSNWSKIIAELRKCVLLCGNCHGEVHDGLHPTLESSFNESYAGFKELTSKEEFAAARCKDPKRGKIGKSKIPSKEDLENDLGKMTKTAICEKYDLYQSFFYKLLKRYGLK